MLVIENVRIFSRGKWVLSSVVIQRYKISEILYGKPRFFSSKTREFSDISSDTGLKKVKTQVYQRDVSNPLVSEDNPDEIKILDGEEGYLVPGMFDPHVHVREPGQEYKEDWFSCSRAALKGGVTSIIDMPNNRPPTISKKELLRKMRLAEKKSAVNYGFHFGLTDKNLNEVFSDDVQRNICGVKVYIAETTGGLLVSNDHVLTDVFLQPKPVLVHTGGPEGLEKIIFHYESAMRKHPLLSPLYICHISLKEEVKLIERVKKKYSRVFCEVTPHHLLLSKDDYRGLPSVKPPLSSKDDIEALWEGLSRGIIDTIGSDHAPHTREEKLKPVPPSGFPGLETTIPLVYSFGMKNHINLEILFKITSFNSRRIFCRESFNELAEGFPPELSVLKEGEYSISEGGIDGDIFETKAGWSPFQGFKVAFKPIITVAGENNFYINGDFYVKRARMIC